MFELFLPVRILGGEGVLRKDTALRGLCGSRCLIVTDGVSAALSGALADAEAVLDRQGIAYISYDKIGPNPLTAACHEAGMAAKAFGAEFLLGIGGGSVLDAAKAAALYAANPDMRPENIFASLGGAQKPLPIALVGTTAGTGSEVTRISVLTDSRDNKKKSVADDGFYAKVVFADPSYTHSMPYAVSLSTGLDALAHVLEGWLKAPMNEVGRLFGTRSISLLWENLRTLWQSKALPDAAGRAEFYYASLYAGAVINLCGTAFCHGMGYILTEDYDVPHGFACAVFLPELLDRAKSFAPKKYQEIEAAFGADLEAVTETLFEMAALPSVRMSVSQVEAYRRYWEKNPPKNFATSPGGLTPEEAASVLKRLFT